MKEYVKPLLQQVTLKPEESISTVAPICDGACEEDIIGPDGSILYHAHGSQN